MHAPIGRVGTGPETGDKVFDPYGFATMGGDKSLAFFRHAEIKHGRVAMAATVGLLFHINHIHFDGYLSPTFGVTFAELSAMGPFDAWNGIPLLGQMQAPVTPPLSRCSGEGVDPSGGVPAPAAAHKSLLLLLRRSSSRSPAWSMLRSAWTRPATTPRAASPATSSSSRIVRPARYLVDALAPLHNALQCT